MKTKFQIPIPLKMLIANEISFSFPKKVFRKGENILIDIDKCEDLCNKETHFEFYLVQYILYQTDIEFCCFKTKEKRKHTILGAMESTCQTKYTQSIEIPENIPSTIEYLDNLKIRYALEVYIDNFKFKFPIWIGDFYRNEGDPLVEG